MEVEQKPFTRKKPQQLVYLELGSGNGGMLLSISEEGFRFRAVSPVRADGPMPFAFSLDGINRLEGSGEIESLEDDGKSGGLRFTEFSGEFRGKLANWLSTDSSAHFPGREVAPAAAVPLDTMEKIREEIRAGRPVAPRESQPVAPSANAPSISVSPVGPGRVVRESTPPATRKTIEVPAATSRPAPSEIPAVNRDDRNGPSEKVLQAAPVQAEKVVRAIPDGKISQPTIPDRVDPDRSPESTDTDRQVLEPPVAEHPVIEIPVDQPSVSKLLISKLPVAGQPVAGKTAAKRPVAEKSIVQRTIPQQKSVPVFSEHLPETRENPNSATRLFPHPAPSTSEPEKPAALASAFLRLAHEKKAPAGTPVNPAPVFRSVSRAPRAGTSAAATPASPPIIPALDDVPDTVQPRRYVEALDVSLDMAWEQAKLSSPEPPHLSRAAAGGIILIALAVILGALAFNFRQEIGAVFIQLGQRISGGNGAAAPTQDVTPENQPSDARNTTPGSSQPEAKPQSVPANSGITNKAASALPITNGAATPSGDANKKAVVTNPGTLKSASSNPATETAKPAEKPQEIAPAENPTDVAAKTETPAVTGIGQEEFEAAQGMLRGKYREQELSRAVNLLWASVKKGYVPAEVTLGDLYRRGDGVEKNCDQARVLLVAASKKGSADARQQLEQMAEKGCQ